MKPVYSGKSKSIYESDREIVFEISSKYVKQVFDKIAVWMKAYRLESKLVNNTLVGEGWQIKYQPAKTPKMKIILFKNHSAIFRQKNKFYHTTVIPREDIRVRGMRVVFGYRSYEYPVKLLQITLSTKNEELIKSLNKVLDNLNNDAVDVNIHYGFSDNKIVFTLPIEVMTWESVYDEGYDNIIIELDIEDLANFINEASKILSIIKNVKSTRGTQGKLFIRIDKIDRDTYFKILSLLKNYDKSLWYSKVELSRYWWKHESR